MKKIAGNATAMGAAMTTVSALAASRMFLLGSAIAVVAGHAVALGQSAIVAAGAIALIPAAIAGAIGTAVAGTVAFGGLGEAWKQTGTAAVRGGGASVDAAHRVELANRGVRDATYALADAQREASDAQQALTRARENAAEQLEDLSRSVRGAHLDERGATLALKEARDRLAQAKKDRNADEIKRAQLAYDEAALSLETVRDRVADLSKEQQEANTKGVEGSDEVQSAIQRQEQAQRQLVAATEHLADAQRELAQAGKSAGGGIDRAKQALDALAPSAAAMVLTLRAMAPAWVAAGKGAQQATWAGVAGDMQNLGMIYLPRVAGWLRRMGEGFNLAIRETLGLAQTNAFARDVGTSLESIDQTVLRLAASIRPVVNGIMQFVAVGSGFFPGIASSVGSIAERFERWAIAARESGRMQQWISTGLAALGQFWALTKNVTMSVIGLFKAGENTATLTGLVAATAAMRAWIESAQGQQAIAGFMANLRNLFNSIAPIIGAIVSQTGGLADIFSVTVVVAGFLADHLETFKAVLPLLIDLYIGWKIIQLVNNGLMLASAIYTAASTAAKWLHVAATIAMNSAIARSTATWVLARAAMIGGAIATGVVTAANWLMAASTWAVLGPILLVIAAIALLVVGVILVIKYHKQIGEFFVFIWGKIWDFLKMIGAWFAGPFVDFFKGAWDKIVGFFANAWAWIKDTAGGAKDWVVNKFTALVDFFKGLPGKIKSAASSLWDGLKDSFRSALNWLIGKWNAFHLTLGGGTVLGMSIPSVTLNTPDIPMLDVGSSNITRTGLAVVHEGEAVVPAKANPFTGGGSGNRDVRVIFGSDGSAFGDFILEAVRTAVRKRGGSFDDVMFER